ncbi:MAG TPA: argininosuccinate lyase [Trueperaceae bacterium]
MSWHASYRERVLAPDYRFAGTYLLGHLLDSLTAHVRTVARLPSTQNEEAQHDIARLNAALLALHDQPLPPYRPEVPDAYFALNQKLEAALGSRPVGYLRMGLSRNDLDMTVYKMRAREVLLNIASQLLALRYALLAHAQAQTDTVLIAHTHHQPGQPITVAHYLCAIDNVVARDQERLFAAYARLNTCPLGAAALAGSSHPLDRPYTAMLLGFDAPVDNTYDAVASSDWQVEVVGVSQSCALNLSRFVCDLLSWVSQGTYRLGDGLVQGSSIMPQKRNPVALEHARTRFSRAIGAAQMVLYSSHNIPYGDLNDFGPDVQGALQTQYLQLSGGLALLSASLEEGRFDTEVLEDFARATDTTATELADELVRRCGLSFQEAHALVGRLVARANERGDKLQQLTPEDVSALGGPPLDIEILKDALDPHAFVRRRTGYGGPAPEVVHEQLTRARSRLNQDLAWVQGTRDGLDRARQKLHTLEEDT